ncbi:hypothetical protein SanaruYs_10370 [Chryseotalea sanaruensis]|uniref:Lipoprotein n=1 Tax=Chryseotalea sanaruensis TaxID=2482724 RepID=A0A401U7F9_9BACT|nr:hypothetical protein [Chryseotalea sanaruensis]GCC50819.1 hypothetical protein SanaruYs_10370 [Chryseotalea sanaruensis]
MKEFILFMIVFVFAISCTIQRDTKLKPTNNKGGYTINKYTSNELLEGDSAIIYGYVKQYDSFNSIPIANINIACVSVLPDSTGYYQIKGKAGSETTFLTCVSIGQKSIETEFFKLQRGDSLNINFFLVQDDRALINCEEFK